MASLVEVDAEMVNKEGWPDCSEISTTEARALGMILDEASGVTKQREGSDYLYDVSGVTYVIPTGLDEDSEPGPDEFWLTLWPVLPHGVPAFAGGA
jgi:hypothetical protein